MHRKFVSAYLIKMKFESILLVHKCAHYPGVQNQIVFSIFSVNLRKSFWKKIRDLWMNEPLISHVNFCVHFYKEKSHSFMGNRNFRMLPILVMSRMTNYTIKSTV